MDSTLSLLFGIEAAAAAAESLVLLALTPTAVTSCPGKRSPVCGLATTCTSVTLYSGFSPPSFASILSPALDNGRFSGSSILRNHSKEKRAV